MSLPTTLTCVGCSQPIQVDDVIYRGLQQPDPLQDGQHAYMVTAQCPSCKVRVVQLHKEATQQ